MAGLGAVSSICSPRQCVQIYFPSHPQRHWRISVSRLSFSEQPAITDIRRKRCVQEALNFFSLLTLSPEVAVFCGCGLPYQFNMKDNHRSTLMVLYRCDRSRILIGVDAEFYTSGSYILGRSHIPGRDIAEFTTASSHRHQV